jgi:hypothetical protein
MRKVTMNLTDRDVENAKFLREMLETRSEAQVVSIALSLTKFIVSALRQPGTQILLREPNGNLARIVMHELENIPKQNSSAAQSV